MSPGLTCRRIQTQVMFVRFVHFPICNWVSPLPHRLLVCCLDKSVLWMSSNLGSTMISSYDLLFVTLINAISHVASEACHAGAHLVAHFDSARELAVV